MTAKKFTEAKKETEQKINNIVSEFIEETGVAVNYIDFSKKKPMGFSTKKRAYETKIILKND